MANFCVGDLIETPATFSYWTSRRAGISSGIAQARLGLVAAVHEFLHGTLRQRHP